MRPIDRPIWELMGFGVRKARTRPLIGIEIEAEGTNLVSDAFNDQSVWSVHDEGSLRNGVEYVLRAPLEIEDLRNAMKLWDELTKKAKFDQSIRTSVHIHFNACRRSPAELYKVLTVYWLVENLLVELNGRDRVGNLFCLRLSDAENMVDQIVDEIRRENYFQTWTEEFRYSAVNLSSLRKFGSLEYRFIKGLTDSKLILEWVECLRQLMNVSLEFESPLAILNYFYQVGSKAFLKRVIHPDTLGKMTHWSRSFIDSNMAMNTGALYEIASHINSPKKHRPPLAIKAEDEDLQTAPAKKKIAEAPIAPPPPSPLQQAQAAANTWANTTFFVNAPNQNTSPVFQTGGFVPVFVDELAEPDTDPFATAPDDNF